MGFSNWISKPETKGGGYQCVVCDEATATADEEICERCQGKIADEEVSA